MKTPWVIRFVEAVLAFLLLAMVVMVFGNVVLRYVFNSGLVLSEELSRYAFIWLTFIGAVLAAHEGAHLGMDNVVSKLSRRGKMICLTLCECLILVCCVLLFRGTMNQHQVNATNMAPVTGMPMIWVYGVSYVTSGLIGVIAVHKLWRIATGQVTDSELIEVSASDEPLGEPQQGRP